MVDVAMPSRTARDALTWHLADAGVPLPADGQLVVRSLADPGAWEPPRATTARRPAGQGAAAPRHGADIGPLSVLCYDHEMRRYAGCSVTPWMSPKLWAGRFTSCFRPPSRLLGRPARATARRRALGCADRTGHRASRVPRAWRTSPTQRISPALPR